MSKTAFEQRFDPDWIRRINEWAAPIADELEKKDKQRQKSWMAIYSKTETFKQSQKKYNNSEKGKIANKKRNCVRHKRFREQSDKLGENDRELIRQFYIKCPQGYHVDHIIPIAKGGKHHIKNLQYLPAFENMSKGSKILHDRSDIIYEFHKFREKYMDCDICKNEMLPLSDETMYCDTCKKAFGITYYENNPTGTP